MLSLNLWHEGVLAPIDADNPIGTNVRLSDSFDHLQQEVNNDLAMDREATDWNKVFTLSNELLTKQSKDLLVLVYSIRAIIATYRYEGMARAIALLPLYMGLYWERSFPLLKRKRARLGALEWLTQHLAVWIETNTPLTDERLQVESVISGIKTLNSKLAEYGDEWPLDTFHITQKLDTYLLDIPNDEVVLPQKSTTSSPTTSPVPSGSAQLEIIDEKSFQSSIRGAQQHLKSLAKYRLPKDFHDPLAYEINRFSTWLPILEQPVHKEKVTPLRPVPLEKRQLFEALYQQKKYETLIAEVENSLASSPFWLDGHRIVVESLKAMGSGASKPYQEVIDSISRQVKGFIARLEGVELLRFSDGTPFADSDTLSWLADLKASDNSASETSAQEPDISFICKPLNEEDTDSCDDEQAILAEANDLLRDLSFSAGLFKLDNYCKRQKSKNGWFRAQMLMAQYCVSAKEHEIAEQLLLELDEVSLNHQLDAWDPETVIELLSMMLICTNKLKRKQEAKDYFNRLSRLSVVQAYAMKAKIN